MRILFITAFYPPHVVGGWEQLVEELNLRLREKGHTTRVLTSDYAVGNGVRDKDVDRLLHLEAEVDHYVPSSVFFYRKRLKASLEATRRAIESFAPDTVFIHIMWNLSRGVAWMAERLCPGKIVYYMADHWTWAPGPHLEYWQDPATSRAKRSLKRALAPLAMKWICSQNRRFELKLDRVLCVSRAISNELQEHSIADPANLHVVYNGVDIEVFHPPSRPRPATSGALALVYAGSLVWHKGVHTAIQALGHLKDRHKDDIRLSIFGSGHPDYEKHLRQLVHERGLLDRVEFRGRVPRERMPSLLREFDVLILPSTWEEPLARITQEAMASGLVVVGTLTGGTGELLVEGETGLTFDKENPEQLARQLVRLRENPQLLGELSDRGRKAVAERFDIRLMVSEVESHLESMLQSGSTPGIQPGGRVPGATADRENSPMKLT